MTGFFFNLLATFYLFLLFYTLKNMFFIILLSLFNQFLPVLPAETEMMCCKMSKNKMAKEIAPCCMEHQKKDCEEDGCGGNCGDPLCHCPATDLQLTIPPTVSNPILVSSKITGKVIFYYLNGYFNLNHPDIWLPPKIAYI